MPQLDEDQRVIVVLDPGLTTGYVRYEVKSGTTSRFEYNFKGVGQALLHDANLHRSKLIIVAESFRITSQTPKNTQAPWSLELIGVARMISMLWCDKDLQLQDPSAAKRFSSDNKLKMMGWYTPGKGHANDASRHLLLFLATRGLIDVEMLKKLADA